MILFWLTEALPLPVTAMIPMVGLPLLGLKDQNNEKIADSAITTETIEDAVCGGGRQ